MTLNKPFAFIFSLVRVFAHQSDAESVIRVTDIRSITVFLKLPQNLVSEISVLKFSRPIKVFSAEYPPHLKRDITNTFTVGYTINIRKRRSDGAMQKKINARGFFI